MDFDLRISFEIEEGLYTLALSEYQPNADIPIAVVEIVLELEKQPLSPNPLKVFFLCNFKNRRVYSRKRGYSVLLLR